MRTRTRVLYYDPKPSLIEVRNYTTNAPIATETVQMPRIISKREWMFYDEGRRHSSRVADKTTATQLPNNGGTPGRKWKNVCHYKMTVLPEYDPVGDRQVYMFGDGYPAGFGSKATTDCVSWYDPRYVFGDEIYDVNRVDRLYDYEAQFDEDRIPRPTDLDELGSRALKSTLPLIREELSLINSLIELKDFVTLKHTIERVRNAFTLLVKNKGAIKLVGKSTSKLTLREILRTSSDGWLQSQFNFLPMFSDLRGVFLAVTRSSDRINGLLKGEGKALNRRFKTEFEEFSDPDDTVVNWYPILHPALINSQYFSTADTIRSTRSVKNYPSIFSYVIRYKFTYSAFQREFAHSLALLDALGVNLDPSTFWNAIPWSFVVDWFVSIGEFLDRLKLGSMDPEISILNACWSIRRRRSTRFTAILNRSNYEDLYPINAQKSITPRVIYEEAYRRQVELPTESLLRTSGLTLNKVSLAASLALSRHSKPSKTKIAPFFFYKKKLRAQLKHAK